MSNCLFCYQPLADYEQDFHASCSKKIFGQPTPPALLYTEEDLEPLAKEVIQSQTAVTGVQAKLSLHITGNNKEGPERRFTIVGFMGRVYFETANRSVSAIAGSGRCNHAFGPISQDKNSAT